MRFSFRSAGESHGAGCLALVEGLPKGLAVDPARIDRLLARRQRGYGRGGRQRIEEDRVRILSGLRGGRTLGSPLALWVENRDARIEELPDLDRPRPGHVDLAACLRHGDRDIRAGLERASARETVARVAAGAVAEILLEECGVFVLGHVVRIGGVEVPGEPGASCAARLEEGGAPDEAVGLMRAAVEASEFGLLEPERGEAMRREIDQAAKERDSLGGEIEVFACGLPPGLGSHLSWEDRLDGRLAQALLSIPAIKGAAFGWGFRLGAMRGSEAHDPIGRGEGVRVDRGANRAGGLEGGLANGAPLVCRAVMKPISTIRKGLPSIDLGGGGAAVSDYERSDVCAVPAAAVVAEAMTALVLAGALLEFFGGATMEALKSALDLHMRRAEAVLDGRGGIP